MTTTTLPGAIGDYLRAKQNHDTDALLATLTADAVITDEGIDHSGLDAIRAWVDRVNTEFAATYAVLDAVQMLDRTVVAVEVAGTFPNSPVTLFFHFTVRAEQIAALTVLV